MVILNRFSRHWIRTAFFPAGIVIAFTFLMAASVWAGHLSAEAHYRAWSGWWWPKHVGELAIGYDRGRPSPVDKYDLYVNGSFPGSASQKAMRQWYNPEAEHWIGFCHGWVNASILEPEPREGSSVDGIFIRVGDKKGLLTACHSEDAQINSYCKGNPLIFHRYLLEYIGDKGQPIGADLDSSEEFWSYPVYAYDMDISTGLEKDQVTCTITYANDFVDPDFVGTDELTHTYTYELDKDLEGNYIGSGRWLGDSAGNSHPEWVWVPVGIRQENLFIDYQKVVEMVTRPSDKPVDEYLRPGHQLLALSPGEPVSFNYQPHSSEHMVCQLALDKQTAFGDGCSYILQRDGVEITRGELDDKLISFELQDSAGLAHYRLKISAAPENRRTVGVHLLVDVDSRYSMWFYGVPSSSSWVGCGVAFTPGTPNAGRAWIEMVDGNGHPVGKGAVSGDDLAAGGSWLEVLRNRVTQDYNFGTGAPVAVKLLSEYEACGLLLKGDNCRLWGGGRECKLHDKLVIPWLTSAFEMVDHARLYLHNQSNSLLSAEFTYFHDDGRPLNGGAETFVPGEIRSYTSGSYPGHSDIAGWALITRAQGLAGSVELEKGKKIRDCLPLLRLGREWLIPHLALMAGWQTELGVCNPGGATLNLVLQAYYGDEVVGQPMRLKVDSGARREIALSGVQFGISDDKLGLSWVKVEGDKDFAGYIKYRYMDEAQASLPLMDFSQEKAARSLAPLAVTDGWWTGVVLVNSSAQSQEGQLSLRNRSGRVLETKQVALAPHERLVASLAGLFPGVDVSQVALLQLDNARDIKALALYGGYYGINQLAAKYW